MKVGLPVALSTSSRLCFRLVGFKTEEMKIEPFCRMSNAYPLTNENPHGRPAHLESGETPSTNCAVVKETNFSVDWSNTPVRIKFCNSLSLKIFFSSNQNLPSHSRAIEITSPWLPHRNRVCGEPTIFQAVVRSSNSLLSSFQERTGTENRHGPVTSTSR